jgi:hypothetical protein
VSFGPEEGWIERDVIQYIEGHIVRVVNATICSAVEKVRARELALS